MLRIDYNNCLAEMVGESDGITGAELDELQPRAETIHAELTQRRQTDLGFYDLPYKEEFVNQVRDRAERSRGRFENFLLLGIGGSALGPLALFTALCHPHHNLQPKRARRDDMRLFVVDNADPEMLIHCLETMDLSKTLVNVVTKSGTTAETMTAFMAAEKALANEVGAENVRDHLVFTTDPKKGILRPLAEGPADTPYGGVATLPIPPNVGGRFSVLSPVGLFPAACCGIDIGALLAGAAHMDRACRVADIRKNPAYLFAAIHYLLDTRRQKSISVMMPYAQALRDIADWYRQLWAESLGKRIDREGREVFVGQTPVKALGATDQHSQVQLFVEGPNDKVHTLIQTLEWRVPCPIPADAVQGVEDLDIFRGRDMAELLTAELDATEYALTKSRRPNLRIELPNLSPETVGALMYMLEVATAFAGGLYSIDAFDQPGVEQGKKATYALMGRDSAADAKERKELEEYQSRRTVAPLAV